MSGILGCIGTWMPIPGQLFEFGMAIMNNVVPGMFDACKHIARAIESAVKSLMVFGK